MDGPNGVYDPVNRVGRVRDLVCVYVRDTEDTGVEVLGVEVFDEEGSFKPLKII